MDMNFLIEETPEGVAQGEVAEFLAGDRKEFSEKAKAEAAGQKGTEFQRAVWGEIARTSWGRVKTYQEVAMAIGRPFAMRAVGTACGRNKYPIVVPCHRIVASSGIGGYGYGGTEIKRELLRREGVVGL